MCRQDVGDGRGEMQARVEGVGGMGDQCAVNVTEVGKLDGSEQQTLPTNQAAHRRDLSHP